jgi:hypothetical protein
MDSSFSMTYPDPPSNLDLEKPSAQDSSFGDILSAFEQTHGQGRGETKQGKVVAISSDTVYVDIGWKTEGVLPLDDFRDPSGKPDIAVGDLMVVTLRGRNAEGYYQLSKIKVERPRDWSALESAFAEKRPIVGIVTGLVKGGLTVDVGVRAFLPASRSGAKTPAEMEQLTGQEITCRISRARAASSSKRSRKVRWSAPPYALSPTSAPSSTWAVWMACCMWPTSRGIASRSRRTFSTSATNWKSESSRSTATRARFRSASNS